MFASKGFGNINKFIAKFSPLSKGKFGAFGQSGRLFSSTIDEEEDLIRRRRATKFVLAVLGLGTLAGFVYLGKPDNHVEGMNDTKDQLHEGVLGQVMNYSRRARRKLFSTVKNFTDPSALQLLPSKSSDDNRPVLVVDLDDTLVHASWERSRGWLISKRPQADFFLAYLSQFYEIIVFSTKEAVYAEPIIARLDPYGVISYRLFRDSTKYVNGVHVKDISHLNRDPSKVVMLDDDPQEYALQPENAIRIESWKGDNPKDTALIDLIPFLETLAISNPQDIRQVLKSYKGTDIPKVFAENQRKFYNARDSQLSKSSKGGLSRLLGTKSYVNKTHDLEQEQQRKYSDFIQNVQWRLHEWKKEVEESQKADSSAQETTT